MECIFQEAARGRPAPTVLLVDVEITATLVVAGIEIVDRRNVALGRGLAERIGAVPAHPRRLDAPFAARSMGRTIP